MSPGTLTNKYLTLQKMNNGSVWIFKGMCEVNTNKFVYCGFLEPNTEKHSLSFIRVIRSGLGIELEEVKGSLSNKNISGQKEIKFLEVLNLLPDQKLNELGF